MKRMILLQIVCASVAFGQANPSSSRDTKPTEDLNNHKEPPALGLHWSRDFDPNPRASHDAGRTRSSSPNMLYHGGKIMPSATTQAIFWGTSWASYSGDKMTGIDSFYQGMNQSNYAATVNEYTGTNGQVTSSINHIGHIVDTSASTGGGSTATILAEVCKVISPDKSGNGYYAVYTDTPRGNANYCAYHSYGTCGGTPVQFAYFFKLDGDPGCDPADTSGLHSQGLAAIANVSAHELAEARSDPANPPAWYDASGAENGDKCAWTFNAPLITFSNNTQWKVQGEWSNVAYTNGTGYANSSGQKGCLSGK